MNILSLFDGIACAKVALEKSGLMIENYYASEIDGNAIKVALANHPTIKELGDVKTIGNTSALPPIDLLIGGSPCQDLSIANAKRTGLTGSRSGLFYEFVRIKNELQPKYWILENVASMAKDARLEISQQLQVEPILINANLVSAQNRRRLFWTNIPIAALPEDKHIFLKDVLCPTNDEYFYRIEPSMLKALENKKVKLIGLLDKCQTVTTKQRRWNNTGFVMQDGRLRYFTPEECELLQGLPKGYTAMIPLNERYKCLGNAFNVDVIGHILGFVPEEVANV